MSEETQTRSDCVLWIDHTDRVISFKKAEGFEAKVFSTGEEKSPMPSGKAPRAIESNNHLKS